MPLPKRRHTKSRRDKGRTHFKLRRPPLAKCPNCGAPKLAHLVCGACGYYGGIKIIEVKQKKEKKKK